MKHKQLLREKGGTFSLPEVGGGGDVHLLPQSRRAPSLPPSLSHLPSRRWEGGGGGVVGRNPRGPLSIIQGPLPIVHGPLDIMQGPHRGEAVERNEREDNMVLVKLGHPRARSLTVKARRSLTTRLTSLTTRV